MGFRVWGSRVLGLRLRHVRVSCQVSKRSASVSSVDVAPPALLIILPPQGLIRS